MRRTTTVRITSDREQFMSCPLETLPRSIEAWEKNRGQAILVFLPPVQSKCGGKAWEIVPESIGLLDNPKDEDSCFVCEHEIELD